MAGIFFYLSVYINVDPASLHECGSSGVSFISVFHKHHAIEVIVSQGQTQKMVQLVGNLDSRPPDTSSRHCANKAIYEHLFRRAAQVKKHRKTPTVHTVQQGTNNILFFLLVIKWNVGRRSRAQAKYSWKYCPPPQWDYASAIRLSHRICGGIFIRIHKYPIVSASRLLLEVQKKSKYHGDQKSNAWSTPVSLSSSVIHKIQDMNLIVIVTDETFSKLPSSKILRPET